MFSIRNILATFLLFYTHVSWAALRKYNFTAHIDVRAPGTFTILAFVVLGPLAIED